MPTSSTEKEMHKSPTLLPVQKEEELLFYEIKKYIPETDHRRILTAFPERKLQRLSKQVNTPIHTILNLKTPEKKTGGIEDLEDTRFDIHGRNPTKTRSQGKRRQ